VSDAATWRAAFVVLFGEPKRLPDREPGRVLVFRHSSREAAEVSAARNRSHHGHPSHVEQQDGGWLTVVDLRPSIADIEAKLEAGRV
jgi:hypothetical protein